MTVRYLRLRSASRMLVSFGVIILIVAVIIAATGPSAAVMIALEGVLPLLGSAMVLGGIVFGAAASFVMDEKPTQPAQAGPVAEPAWPTSPSAT